LRTSVLGAGSELTMIAAAIPTTPHELFPFVDQHSGGSSRGILVPASGQHKHGAVV
jgi:hypothetical protein